ncbi:hypothetical protein BDB00DRAFT_811377 [Zychaea mexicana]|uniref:uncharacterized protein n=1 Tax=Zychaea mexicana TaxID=64656 RepID=UPI0022FE1F96|nr:uncharacterized protein BDB00DRAFT_811377 [Zychaea mexicana]KAI9496007.1 hypothetical protein BDB00DRAFT_811377 [Zychaea mexicana]
MSYFCHSCQEQTDVIASSYLACQQCFSDFVEEIEPTHTDRTWSDEDEALASLWNYVFRNGLDDSPIPGAYPRQDSNFDDVDDLHVASSDENFHYAFAGYAPEEDHDEEEEEVEEESEYREYIERATYDDGEEDDSDNDSDYEETQSPWPAHSSNASQHYTDDDDDDVTYQDVGSYEEEGSLDEGEFLSIRDVNEDSYAEYLDDDDNGDDDDDDEEYSLFSYERAYTIDERVEGRSFVPPYDLSDDDSDNEEEEDEERIDMVRAEELMRELLIDDGDDEEYVDGFSRSAVNDLAEYEDAQSITEINDYEGASEDYHGSGFDSSFDPAYEFSTLLRIIREQHEATFRDASNWETGRRDVVGASEDTIAALPRHRLATGDGATQNECSICLDNFGSSVDLVDLPCMHGFHGACIEKWLQVNASCPVCRCSCS